jgi:hypothetical protein
MTSYVSVFLAAAGKGWSHGTNDPMKWEEIIRGLIRGQKTRDLEETVH